MEEIVIYSYKFTIIDVLFRELEDQRSQWTGTTRFILEHRFRAITAQGMTGNSFDVQFQRLQWERIGQVWFENRF